VGCGFVAQNIHIPNFKSLPECDFLAIAEARPELGQKVAEYYGVPRVCSSHTEIAADPDIEAVGVSGPYALQGAIAEDLLRAGKHVFMEKPMAVSVARAQGIVDAEQKSRKRLMVGYMKRYDSGNVRLKAIADEWRASGEAGNLVYARNHGFGGNWVYAQDPNVASFKAPEGAAPPPSPDECPDWLPAAWKDAYLGYLQQWTHNLNLLRFFLDDTAGTARVDDVHLGEDGMTGVVVFNINGTRAVVESAYLGFTPGKSTRSSTSRAAGSRPRRRPLMQKNTPATWKSTLGARWPESATHARVRRPAVGLPRGSEALPRGVALDEPFDSSASDTLTDVRLFEEIYREFLSQRGEL
jgi:predicted dehydrogenase